MSYVDGLRDQVSGKMNIQHYVAFANLLLIAASAYLGVGVFYQTVGLQIQAPQNSIQVSAGDEGGETTEDRGIDGFSTIMERDLFKTQKTPQPVETKQEIDLDSLAATSLKLKLWGTVSGDIEQPYAVIEDTQKREQHLFRIGDSIQNAVVKMILREKVVITVDGKDEVLAMEKVEQGGGRSHLAARGPMPPANMGDQPVPIGTQRISLRRDMINDAMQDVSKLMTDIAIAPHLDNGQPAGLSLNNIKPNSIFRRMGLRNGDVLVGVEGQDIRSVDDALRLYDSLKSSDNVSVQVKRRGQDRTINYNIR